jgi:Icc-related predicted phosphoesterase
LEQYMKIVAISDLHGYLPKALPDGDCLVIAGDVCPDLRPLNIQAQWAKEQLGKWLEEKKNQYRNIILTWGNHDFVDSYGDAVAWHLHDRLNDFEDGPPPSFVYIADRPETIKLGKYIFYVNPYCLTLPGWAYQTGEDCLADMYREIPLGVDVIVSHGPPMDYQDKIIKDTFGAAGSFHAGSYELKKAIRKAQPKAVICGHIHESFGKYTLHHHGQSEVTTIYNVAQLDVKYKYHNRPVEFEI